MEAQPMTQIEESKTPLVAETPHEKLQYSCRKCRKLLFTEENLEEHTSKVKSYNTRSNTLKEAMVSECTSIFIQEMDWVQHDINEQIGHICCPKCSEKIGKVFIYGAQCSCGRFVAPGYQIHKSK